MDRHNMTGIIDRNQLRLVCLIWHTLSQKRSCRTFYTLQALSKILHDFVRNFMYLPVRAFLVRVKRVRRCYRYHNSVCLHATLVIDA